MSKIDELIQQYCPDGVEFVAVPDFAELKAGKAIVSSDLEKDATPLHPYPCFGGNGIRGYIGKMSHDGEYAIIGRQGALCGCVNWGSGKFYATEHAVVCTPKANAKSRYLFYLFSNADLNQYKSQGAQPGLSVQRLNELYFPLPPLPIQEEIVRILDTFTELQAELQTELQARQKQNEYYQDFLLNKSQFSNHLSIGNLCLVKKGKTPIQKAKEGKYPLVVTAMERRSCSEYQFDANAVCIPLISSRGHGVASLNHVYYQEGKFALGNILCAVIPLDESVIKAKFLYYYLEYAKDYTLVPLMKGGANVSMHCSDIEKVKIPVPSIEQQEKIISILDKFDTLVNDLSQGLPAEIEARKQQYEYYRDKFLTFKRK